MTLNVQNAKKIGIGGSKNLFDKSVAPIATSAGISVSQLSTGIRVLYDSGSTTTGGKYILLVVGDINSYAGKTITISMDITVSASNKARMRFGLCQSDGSDRLQEGGLDAAGSVSFTPSSTDLASRPFLYMRLYANVENEGTLEVGDYIDYTNLQVEVSPVATSYTPYVAPSEVRAIHDKDKKLIWGKVQYDTKYMGDLEQVNYDGKNLFNNQNVEIGKNYNGAVGTVAYPFNTQSDRAAVLMSIEPSTTYNFSMTDGSLYLMEVRECDADYTVTRRISAPNSNSVDFNFTSQSNGKYLVAKFKYGSAGTEVVTQAMADALTLQLEKGSSATPYEPYVGGISSPNPDYPQPINVAKGTQTIDMYGKNIFNKNATPAVLVNLPTASALPTGVRITCNGVMDSQAAVYVIDKMDKFIGNGLVLKSDITASGANVGGITLVKCSADGSSRTNLISLASSGSVAYVPTEVDSTKPYLGMILRGSSNSGTQIGDYVDYTNLQLEVKENLIKGSYQVSGGLTSVWNPRGDTVHTSGTATATAVGLMPLDSAGVPSGHRYRCMLSTAIQFGVKLKVNYTDGGYVQPVINAGSTYIDFDIPSDKIVAAMAVQSTGMTVGTSYNSTFSVALVDITPSPYEAYQHSTKKISLSSKNLFSFNNGVFAVGPSSSNVSQTHTDNSVHMEAIGTTGAQYVKVDYSGLDSSKNYTISCKAKKIVKGTDGRPRLKLNIYKSSDGSTWSQLIQDEITDPVQGQEYTLSSTFTGYQYYRFYFYNNTYTPVTVGEETEYWDIQLEEGDTATTYEPYHIALGKNLFDINSLANADIKVADGVATGVMSKLRTDFGQKPTYPGIPFDPPAGQMAISVTAYTDGNEAASTNNGLRLVVEYTDGTSVNATWKNSDTSAVQKTIITDSSKTVSYLYFTYGNYANNIWHLSGFQIELGDTVTTYESCARTPLELAGLNQAQDYFYYNSGNWYLKRKVGEAVMDGSSDESWIYQSATTVFTLSDYVDYDKTLTFSPICNYFLGASILSYNQLPDHYVSFLRGTSDNNRFVLKYTAYSDATALKTWLSAHPLTVYYALATATDTRITYPALLAQLEAIRDWMIRAGYTQTVVGDLPIVINKEDL